MTNKTNGLKQGFLYLWFKKYISEFFNGVKLCYLPAHLKLWAVRPFSTAKQVRMLRKLVVTDCRLALWASLWRRSRAGLLLINTPGGAIWPLSPWGLWAATAARRSSTQSCAWGSLSARRRSTSSGKMAWKREQTPPSASSRCTAKQEAREYRSTGSHTGPRPSVWNACSWVRLSTKVKALQLLRSLSWYRRPTLSTSVQCWVNRGRALGRTSGREGGKEAALGSSSLGLGETADDGSPWRWVGRATKTRSQRSRRHSRASHWQGARSCNRVLLKKRACSTRPSWGWGAPTFWQWDNDKAVHSCLFPLLSRL